ncbi:hypothetical protein [Amycolatopsis sp. TNS106]|uniref:hypothetical protein n=1 Tax=Amycolatopsis sp. TNS106 TaxID=2861750 RepID=UPI001C57C244|nr:hypothetical protein [Amycolatopsis sp. TNS106]QXV57436.1 hypothetical protein CVV72_10835 [Amycolatopsis sp. TNS106]
MSGVTVRFGAHERTGDLRHDDDRRYLVLETQDGDERISMSLEQYSLVPEPGNVFIKDWSEHAGLTASLEAQGLVTRVHTLRVGQFRSTAYEVKVTL